MAQGKGKTGKKTANRVERELLREQMKRTQISINQAYNGFNMAADATLVEYYIYEIKALQTRMSYLLQQLRTLDGIADVVQAPTLPEEVAVAASGRAQRELA